MILALLLDGTLSYDIFDLRVLTFTGWLGLLLVFVICGSIAWADSAKKNQKKNNQR